ncbi:MAG: hypothetical protein ACREEC_03095, partial [Thermoplasmata archaeon]
PRTSASSTHSTAWATSRSHRGSDAMDIEIGADLIDLTIETWEPILKRDLTPEEARQIAENVTGLFRTLLRWKAMREALTANDEELEERTAA